MLLTRSTHTVSRDRFVQASNRCSSAIRGHEGRFVHCKAESLLAAEHFGSSRKQPFCISTPPISLPHVIPRGMLFMNHTRKLAIAFASRYASDSTLFTYPASFVSSSPIFLNLINIKRTRHRLFSVRSGTSRSGWYMLFYVVSFALLSNFVLFRPLGNAISKWSDPSYPNSHSSDSPLTFYFEGIRNCRFSKAKGNWPTANMDSDLAFLGFAKYYCRNSG